MAGLPVPTPYNVCDNHRAARNAPPSPTSAPAIAIPAVDRSTRASSRAGSAPSATRNPNSCVRCDTKNDVTAYTPIVASRSAMNPNAIISDSKVLRPANCWSTMSCAVVTL